MTLFFPDAGSAALAKYEWGVGTEAAEVIECLSLSLQP